MEKISKVRVMSSEDLLPLFSAALSKVLEMKLGEFIERYRELMPRFKVVYEDEVLSRVFQYVVQGIDYIIVVDSKGRLRGAITYIDMMMRVGEKTNHVLTSAFASVVSTIRRGRVPSETLKKLRASLFAIQLAPHMTTEHRVIDALHAMERTDAHYIIVLTPENNVVGVLTLHTIFRAAVKEMRESLSRLQGV